MVISIVSGAPAPRHSCPTQVRHGYRNRISPYRDYPDTSLGEDLLAEVVHWRARGYSWQETAAKIQWNVNDLCRVCRHDPDYEPALKLAESEYWHESQGAGMRKLREQIDTGKIP